MTNGYGLILISLVLSSLLPLLFIIFILNVLFRKSWPEDLIREEAQGVKFPRHMALAMVTFAVALNLFIYNSNFTGLGAALYLCVYAVGLVVLLPKRKLNPFTASLVAIVVISASQIFIRSNEFSVIISFVSAFLSITALIYYVIVEEVHPNILWFVNSLWYLLLRFSRNFRILFQATKDNKKGILINILKATLITLVVFSLFAGLLSSADPIFGKIIKEFYSEIIGRTFSTIILIAGFLLILAVPLKLASDKKTDVSFFSYLDALIPSIVLSILFGAFIIIQSKYLFGSHEYVREFGITYSEYVRKGFIELLIATFLGGLLTYVFTVKQKSINETKMHMALKITNALLIVEMMCLLVSAFIRDKIYVDMYGFTRVRIIGNLILVWLGFALLNLILFVVVNKVIEKYLWTAQYIASLTLLVVISVINIDRIVVSTNLPRTEYAQKDYFYISMLSSEVVDSWAEIITVADTQYEKYMQSSNLSSNDRKYFADLKLALKNIKRSRVDLDKKFNTEEFIITNICENKYDWNICVKKKDKKISPESDLRQVVDIPYPDGDLEILKPEELELSNAVKTLRTWKAFNIADKKAFDYIQANKDIFYAKLDCLLEQYEVYQVYYNIDLYDEEHYRLNVLTYPFVFRSYSGNRLYPDTADNLRSSAYTRMHGYSANYWSAKQNGYPIVFPLPVACKAELK